MKLTFINQSPSQTNCMEIKAKELPSKGKIYPDSLILRVRPYTLGEVLNFSSSSVTQETKILTILDGIEPVGIEFDKGNLVSIDLDALALLRYSISIEIPIFTYQVKCPKCQNLNTVSVPAEDIVIQDLNIEPVTVSNLKFYSPTIKRVFELNSLDIENDADFYIYTVASYCVTDIPLIEVKERLLNLSLQEFNKLKSLIEQVSKSGVQPIEMTCKHCNSKFSFIPDLLAIPL